MSYSVQIVAPGPRPPYWQVAEHLWGVGCDFDSDGDSIPAESRQWTELTVILRSNPEQRVEIDPLSNDPLVLLIRSVDQSLCQQAADFIVSVAGGDIRRA